MNKSSMRLFVFASLYCLLWSIPLQAAGSGSLPTMFWEAPVDRAIEHRNSVFDNLVDPPNSLTITEWDTATRQRIAARLLADSSAELWHLLIYGIIHSIEGGDATVYFSRALAYAANDPGATWLLFTEFNRYNLPSPSEEALSQLEKQMFIAGARMVPLISSQLLQHATIARRSGNETKALTLYRWVHRFNPYEYHSYIGQAALSGFKDPVAAAKHLMDAGGILASSWPSQLRFVRFLYSTLYIFLTIFLLITGTILGSKYLPLALHRFSHLYGDGVPSTLRTILVSAIFLSVISFGIIPLLWLLLLLIWKHCTRTDRVFASLVMVVLLLAPVNSIIRNRFFHASDTHGHTTRFRRALYEGYSPPVAAPPEETNDLSTILSTMKQQQWSRALAMLGAHPAAKGDPFYENLRGICYFFLGSLDNASVVFQEILATHPSDPSARFNLARCYIALNDATTGMELINQAARKYPDLINGFIQENDHYFSGMWPPLRQVLFPTYPPGRFWKEQFFTSAGADTNRQRYYWSLSFLGIPPLVSFIIFLLLSTAVVLTGRSSPGNRKLRRYFSCKYCGRILCRRCTSGVICPVCVSATRDGAPSSSVEKVRERLVTGAKARFSLRTMLFNIIVPGSGTLLEQHSPHTGTIITFLFSMVVYTFWFSIVAHSSLHLLTIGEIAILLLVPISFHSFFFARYSIGNRHSISSLFAQQSSGKGS